jgi:GTPase SAR1 family protein
MLTNTNNHAKLDALERIRAALKDVAGERISVPGIVVVGAQSSGKSSVLEHATGLAFPRGEGMCTRVPTIVSVESIGDTTDETSSITVASDATYETNARSVDPDDADGFAAAINEATDALTGEGEIGSEPIYVKYKRSGNGPAFTLTDVPGITCLSKTQADVERRTTELTRRMISNNEDTLVLVVLPATDDFHNSKALKIAEEEDPEGKRTIGVVTKVDNLPPGSDLAHRMSGDEIDLRHGFYAVRNRTQQEINDGVGVDALSDLEKHLFDSDPILSQLPASQRGMGELISKICDKRQVNDRLRVQQTEFSRLPSALVSDGDKQVFLLSALAACWNDFRRCAGADTTVLGSNERKTNLSARAHEKLCSMTDSLRCGMPDFLGEDVKQTLLSASREALGYDLSNFLQGPVFREQFSNAIDPVFSNEAETAIDAVAACVRECLAVLFKKHFPPDTINASVVAELTSMLRDELDRRVAATKKLVGRLFEAETRCTYTNNHYLAQTIAKFQELVVKHAGQWKGAGIYKPSYDGLGDGGDLIPKEFMESTASSFRSESNESAAVRQMQITLHAYGKVVHKRYTDSVAVLVLNELVHTLVDDTARFSVEWMPRLLDKLSEDKKVALRRKELTKSITALKAAAGEIDALLV